MTHAPENLSHDLSHATAVVLTGHAVKPRRAGTAPDDESSPATARRPFAVHALDRLAAAGVRDAVLCVLEGADHIQAALGDQHKTVRLTHLTVPSGTAAALRLALPRCASDPILVLNGDSVCRVDLRAVWRWHFARSADATLVLSRTADPRQHGRVLVGRSFRIFGFQDKPETRSPGWTNAGIYVLSRRLLDSIQQDASSLEQDVLPTWIPQSLHGFPTAAPLLDSSTPGTQARTEQRGEKHVGQAT